jgi:short-subunit dehydrogenase
MTDSRGIVWITGASSGIGWATALMLAKDGWTVAASARNEKALNGLKERHENIHVYPLDVVDSVARKEVYGKIRNELGTVEILINNAGYGLRGAIEEVEMHEVRSMYDVNVFAPMALTKLVLPDMRENRSGHIIMVSSVVGRVSMPINGHYSSSKFALEGVTDALRVEMMPWDIKVTLIEPGPIKTSFAPIAVGSSIKRMENQSSPYYKHYQGYLNSSTVGGKRTWGAASVAHVIRHAINSAVPKARYPVHPMAHIAPILRTILPTPIFDKIMGEQAGITK